MLPINNDRLFYLEKRFNMNDINNNKLTIYKVLEMSAKRIPNREIFTFPETGKRYCYSEFNDKVNKACGSLMAIGVKSGSHVGLWMDSIEEWFVLFFAINKLGAIAIPINTSFKSSEMHYILKTFDIDYLFMSEGYDKKYPKHIKRLIPDMRIPNDEYSRLKDIVTIGFCNDNCILYDDFIKMGDKTSEKDMFKYDMNSNDICIILPTSGTTGMSKGVELTNFQLIKNGYDIGERYILNKDDKMLIQVPMFHCFGITLSMLAALTHFTPMCVIGHFKASAAIDAIRTEKITCMNGVPTMYRAILDDQKFDSTDFSSLTKGIMAGSNCLPSFMMEASEKIGMRIISVYGLSEASPGCTMSSVEESEEVRFNTVGLGLPDIDCKIVDPETGLECPVGVNGEFIVKGYNVMNGYYNNSDMTASVIDDKGYLHTGDIAARNPDGTYVIMGRYKDTIIRGGENIYPKEVELIMNQCPGVKDSCAFGVDDDRFGQEVAVCVIADDNVTESDIRSFMGEIVAKHKIPRYFFFVNQFIKNAAGKVMVRKMAEVYSKKIVIDN